MSTSPSPASSALRAVLAGWAAFLLMVALAMLVRPDDRGAMVAFAVIGLVFGGWVWFRRSRASLIASLVVGILHTLEQSAYTWAGVTEDHPEAMVIVTDAIGLISGIVITGGAYAALRERSRGRRSAIAGDPVEAHSSVPR